MGPVEVGALCRVGTVRPWRIVSNFLCLLLIIEGHIYANWLTHKHIDLLIGLGVSVSYSFGECVAWRICFVGTNSR